MVDDEKDIQVLFEQRLKKAIREKEAKFVFAFFGDEALRYLTQQQHEAVLILSDIDMPGISVFEPLQKIREQFHSPPPIKIMITAYGEKENYDNALRMGADDFLTKPIDFVLLKQKLKLS